MPPINTREDLGLSDQQLILMKTTELNKYLKRKGTSKERAKQIKAERRTLKNRGYAANCRVKRESDEKSLEHKNDDLRKAIYMEQVRIGEAKKETERLIAVCKERDAEIHRLMEEEKQYSKTQTVHVETGLKALLANRTEIKWEKVKEQDQTQITSSVMLERV